MIYFIRCECPNGFIKIGRARDIGQRLSKLQCGTPYRLTVIRVLAGGIVGEAFLRRHFADAHERGEWYRPTPKLLAYIEDSAIACLGPNPPPEPVSRDEHERRAVLAEARVEVIRAQAGIAPRRRSRKPRPVAAGTHVPVRRLRNRAPFRADNPTISVFCGMVGATGIEPVTPTMSTCIARWKRWNIKAVSGMQPAFSGTSFPFRSRLPGTPNQGALRYPAPPTPLWHGR